MGLLTATLLVLGLAACEYNSDKTHAAVRVTTGLYDGEDAYVRVEVRNDTSGELGVEIDVEDGSGRDNATFEMAPGPGYSWTPFDDPEIHTWNPDGVDVWVRIYNPVNNQTLEWHSFDNVAFE